MKLEELMFKLQYLTTEEVENPKLEIEHLTRISPHLHLDNPLTYIIFLNYRPDLPDEERELYLRIVKAFQDKEREEFEEALKRFETEAN
jgi:hypothetical protein